MSDQRLVADLRARVEGKERCHGEGQVLWKGTVFLNVAKEARHASCSPLGYGVQGNRQKCMFYEGVIESAEHCLCEGLKVCLRKGQGRDHFVEDRLLNEVKNHGIVHGFQNDVITAKVGSQYKGGVCTV